MKKKRPKKNDNQYNAFVKMIVLITVILQLISSVIEFFKTILD